MSAIFAPSSQTSRASSYHSHGSYCSHDSDRSNDSHYSYDSDGSFKSTSTYQHHQESFETYQDKIKQLCREIGFGEPCKVERMIGGSFNRIIGIDLPSGEQRSFVIRIPRSPLDERQPHEISDQVSLFNYFSQWPEFKVPKVFAYDTTTNNAIESQYVIQARLPGKSLDVIYYDLPLADKLHIASQVAEICLKLQSTKFKKPGRLVGTRALPAFSHERLPTAPSLDITGFRLSPFKDYPAEEKQSLTSLLVALFEHQKQPYLEAKQNTGNLTVKKNQERMVNKFATLQAIVKQMDIAGLVKECDDEYVLLHWDFCGRNILLSQTQSAAGCENETSPSSGDAHDCVESTIENVSSGCQYRVSLDIDGCKEMTFKHDINITIGTGNGGSICSELTITGSQPQNLTRCECNKEDEKFPTDNESRKSTWNVSGILDFDDDISVPLVLARAPLSWLWDDEETRPDSWDGSRDDKPARDLTPNELIIKGYIDETMSLSSPTYIDDTYLRGPWLRSLFRFAKEGFGDSADWARYEVFVQEWEEYFQGIAFGDKVIHGDVAHGTNTHAGDTNRGGGEIDMNVDELEPS